MSSVSLSRQHIQNTTNWAAYREQRNHLAELFSAVTFSGQQKLPLALGVKRALVAAGTGLSAKEIGHFLRAYTFGPKYLRGIVAGAYRYDLDGLVCGAVTPDEAHHAAMSLSAHYRAKEHRRTVRKLGLRAVEDALQADAYAEAA